MKTFCGAVTLLMELTLEQCFVAPMVDVWAIFKTRIWRMRTQIRPMQRTWWTRRIWRIRRIQQTQWIRQMAYAIFKTSQFHLIYY